MVIYRSINDIKTERSIDYKPKIYVRPASMWNEIVNGVERFQYIGRTLPKPIHQYERHQKGLKSLKVQKATLPKKCVFMGIYGQSILEAVFNSLVASSNCQQY